VHVVQNLIDRLRRMPMIAYVALFKYTPDAPF